jgi:hypothetical protein
MGRSMLIIVTSMFLVFSLTQIGVMNRQTQIEGLSVSYAQLSQARNAANSGLERALQAVGITDTLRAPTPIIYQFGEQSASVLILDKTHDSDIPNDHIEIRSTGISGTGRAQVIARVAQDKGLPYVSGAMSIYGENIVLNKFDSNALLISGVDRDGNAETLPALTSNTSAGYNDIMDQLPTKSYDNIQGLGYQPGPPIKPSVAVDVTMDPAVLVEFVTEAKNNRHYTCVSGNTKCEKDSGTEHPGTIAQPKIMVIQPGGTYNLDKGPSAGIIIVEEGGRLDLTGNPEFHGLIIMMGSLNIVNGNPKIYGGMIFSGSNPTVEIGEEVEVSVNGNANIQYSSTALNNIAEKLPVASAKRQFVTYILD